MTTLSKVRSELHALSERRSRLTLRVRTDELVPRRRLLHVSISVGHRQRDAILNGPTRYASILAAEHGVDGRALLRELTRILEAECRAIAAAGRTREAG